MKPYRYIMIPIVLWSVTVLAQPNGNDFPGDMFYLNGATVNIFTTVTDQKTGKVVEEVALKVTPEGIFGPNDNILIGMNQALVVKKVSAMKLSNKLSNKLVKKNSTFWVLNSVIMKFEGGKLKEILGFVQDTSDP